MDTSTLNRDKGDLNFNAQTYLSNSQHISIQSSSISEKTQSLSIISNNETQLVLKDILAFEGQIDGSLFNEEFKFSFILSERIEFHSIEQIINQRILIEDCQNCRVYNGMMIGSQQLIVIKEMLFYQEEELIKILDEFKIQNKLNKLFPQQSLLLFTPVKVEKLRQSYGLKAVMEKAEANLFIYSKKNIISANQAFTIYRQLLTQIINMHSIQIAHRDVKPQNIFYVKNKGWLLSDFGESQEYDDLESNYNIRGTLFFLMPYIQAQVNRGKQIQQNLLVNDLYALAVTIIIIQKINYIDLIDLKQEINNIRDPYLVQTLNIKTYLQLVEFYKELPEINQEFQFNIHDNYYKQLSSREEQYNNSFKYKSWIDLCSYYIENQIFPDITNQLFQLIIDNLDKIQNMSNNKLWSQLLQLKLSGKLIVFNPIRISKQISKMNMEQKELFISLLFNYGYVESTVFYCQQILSNQYNQFIHLKLIDSLEKLTLYSEAQQQFNIFQQGLIFEPLNSEYQQQFLIKAQQYGQNNLQINFGQKLEDLLITKNVQQVNVQAFKKDLNQYEQFDCQNTELIVNLLEMQIKENCRYYNQFSHRYFFQLTSIIISGYSLNILWESLRRIYNLRVEVLDTTSRTQILFDLAQICILQDKKTNFSQIVKIIKTQIFKTESLQQNITFKIQSLVLKFSKLLGKKCTHKLINKLYLYIQKIKLISYNTYRFVIQEYLLYFFKSLSEGHFQYLSSVGIKLVIIIIDYMHDFNYHQQNFILIQFCLQKSQKILTKQLNFKRQLKLIRDNQDCLSQQVISYFQSQYSKRFINRKNLNQRSELEQQKQFLFEQFLQKE